MLGKAEPSISESVIGHHSSLQSSHWSIQNNSLTSRIYASRPWILISEGGGWQNMFLIPTYDDDGHPSKEPGQWHFISWWSSHQVSPVAPFIIDCWPSFDMHTVSIYKYYSCWPDLTSKVHKVISNLCQTNAAFGLNASVSVQTWGTSIEQTWHGLVYFLTCEINLWSLMITYFLSF